MPFSSSVTTMFGGVAISVSMPLMSAAYDIGMSRCCSLSLASDAIRNTMGMKTATTAVELMTAPSVAAASMMRIRRRVSLDPPRARSQIEVRAARWPGE